MKKILVLVDQMKISVIDLPTEYSKLVAES
jgi:hypothetical protein